MPLEIKVDQKQEKHFTVFLSGSIDSETHGRLEEGLKSILAIFPEVVIFDMSGVDYISSMGVSVILKTKLAIETGKGIFILTNLQAQVKNVFKIIEALPNLNIFVGIDEADEYLRRRRDGAGKGQGQ